MVMCASNKSRYDDTYDQGQRQGDQERSNAPPQPPKIYLTCCRKFSKCPGCPPSTTSKGQSTLTYQSSGKMTQAALGCLKFFSADTFSF